MSNQEESPFVKHPTKKFVWVSQDGDIIDGRNGDAVEGHVNSWGYRHMTIAGNTIFVHITVCEVFHGPMPQPDMIVNHIDGNKLNNHKDNLEWATKSENIIHAYKTGLRSDNRRILVKDLTTDKVDEYYSMQEASRFFECNAEGVYRWLSSAKNGPFHNKYDVCYSDGEFKGFTKDDIGKIVNGMPRPVLLIDKDGNHSIYGTLGLASEGAGVHKETIRRHIAGVTKRRPMGDNGYMAHYLDLYDDVIPEGTPNTPYVEPPKVIPVRKPVPVEVTFHFTGEVKVYESSEEFAKSMDMEKSVIQKATKMDMWNGMSIRYIKDETGK